MFIQKLAICIVYTIHNVILFPLKAYFEIELKVSFILENIS